MLVTAHTYAAAQNWIAQAGLTEAFDRANGLGGIGQSITGTYELQVQAAASGPKRSTAAASSDVGNTHILALRPAVSNAPPSVSLTSPANGSTFNAPANILISADASDAEASIQKVEFFHGGTNLIATLTAAPYSITWTGVPQGAYSLTAVATDSHNVNTTSSTVSVTVNREAALHFVHVDHLNAPRLVADVLGATIWRWDQIEPFGNNASENPSAGVFDLPLRLPGQYHDKETGLAHNWRRDYWPEGGRYIQFDAIGLRGGINGYLYVGANPLSWTDPAGLKAFQCRKPLDALGGEGSRSGPDIWGNPAFHQYSCVIDAHGQVACGGQDRTGSALGSPGTPSKDKYDPQRCVPTYDNKCFDDCLQREWQKPRPRYGIPFGTDCQEFDDDVNSRCRKECGLR
jgi:RHS repeat-associated protein